VLKPNNVKSIHGTPRLCDSGETTYRKEGENITLQSSQSDLINIA